MKREREEVDTNVSPTEVPAKDLNPFTNTPYSDKYHALVSERQKLPIMAYKQTIMETVKGNQITLLSGQTGSGKTTQVPQLILSLIDELHKELRLRGKNDRDNISGLIVCTQPRRLAAMSIARRVAEEMDVPLGKTVGYNVRFDNCTSPSTTRIAYYTDGMLIREFVTDKELSRVGVVLVDEAHERTVDTDILLGLLKLLCVRRPSLRVIVMSATLDLAQFRAFFPNSPTIDIPGQLYPVTVEYLQRPVKDYVEAAVQRVVSIHKETPVRGEGGGDILLFLPGEYEIRVAVSRITMNIESDSGKKASVLPLYGSLTLEEQSKVFLKPPEGVRKIVVATNIAETSLTIDGVVYVVDSCHQKQSLYNPVTHVDYLLPTLISKASAKQRAGRAGRTARGWCYRLLTERIFTEELPEANYPEMLRSNVSSTVLMLLRLGYDNPLTFPLITPPSKNSFLDAFLHLTFIGAVDDEGAITALGNNLVEFPVQTVCALTIVKSASFNCSVDAAIIVSMIEAGNCYSRGENNTIMQAKRVAFTHPDSDHLTLFNIYHAFNAAERSAEWCRMNGLRHSILIQATRIYQQISAVMERLRIPRQSIYDALNKTIDSAKLRFALLNGMFMMVGYRPSAGKNEYIIVRSNQKVQLHFTSNLCQSLPEWVFFDCLEMQGSAVFSRMATKVDPRWFPHVSQDFFNPKEIEEAEVRYALLSSICKV